MISIAQSGASRLCPRTPNPLSASPLSSISLYVTLSPCRLLLFASRETPSKVTRNCFSLASWHHQSSLLRPTPPCSPTPLHTLQISVVTSPNVPPLPAVFLYRSSPTAFLPITTLLPPQASPTSCLISSALTSP